MRKAMLIALIIPLLLLFSCQRPNLKKLLPATLVTSVEIGLQAVDETFRLSKNKQVIRYVAVSAATTLARDAVTTLVMSQADRYDPLFGAGRSKGLFSALLAEYCYPLLDDIIIAEIDRRLKITTTSSNADTARADAKVLVTSYLARYGFDKIPQRVLEYITPDTATPKDYAVPGVNGNTFAATRNWKDSGIVYEYRIENDTLRYRRGEGAWQPLTIPGGLVPRLVAADNNRCLVQTADRQLWWYCAKQDQAQWSIEIIQSAVELMALKPVLGDHICEEVLSLLTRITDSVSVRAAASNKLLAGWKTAGGSKAYWSDRCNVLTQVALNVERFILKADSGKTFTFDDYMRWSNAAHSEGAWSNLLSWQANGTSFNRGANIPPDSISDIAIGNWNGTVATTYALALGKVWFIDEEVIQPEWTPIENWNAKWAIVAQEYHPIENSPYPLDSACRIDASNSVIAISKKNSVMSQIYWCRWDYHQKNDFVYWPIDWCEHRWYAVDCPPRRGDDFRISTVGTFDPTRRNTVWSLPAPCFTLHNYLPQAGYQGVFGDVPREQVSTYPVDLFVTDTTGEIRRWSVDKAQNTVNRDSEWR